MRVWSVMVLRPRPLWMKWNSFLEKRKRGGGRWRRRGEERGRNRGRGRERNRREERGKRKKGDRGRRRERGREKRKGRERKSGGGREVIECVFTGFHTQLEKDGALGALGFPYPPPSYDVIIDSTATLQ